MIKKPKSYLFACENLQELVDMALIAEQIKKQFPNAQVILLDLSHIFDLVYDKKQLDFFDEVVDVGAYPKQKFSEMSVFLKFYYGQLVARKIVTQAKRFETSILVTGVPLVFFRWAKCLSPKLIYISYIRAIIANEKNNHSLSGRLFNLMSRTGLVKGVWLQSLMNNWFADYIATINQSNKSFLIKQGIHSERVIESGFIHLHKIEKNDNNREKPRIIFATSAYSAHNQADMAEEQLGVVRYLIQLYRRNYADKYDFELRIHPRDEMKRYQNELDLSGAIINEIPVSDFLATVDQHSYFVSNFSTLNFEWQLLGGKAVFIATEQSSEIYCNLYKLFKIEPITELDCIFEIEGTEVFQPTMRDFYDHTDCHGRNINIDYLVGIISKL